MLQVGSSDIKGSDTLKVIRIPWAFQVPRSWLFMLKDSNLDSLNESVEITDI
jgi:hypothetical protein